MPYSSSVVSFYIGQRISYLLGNHDTSCVFSIRKIQYNSAPETGNLSHQTVEKNNGHHQETLKCV